MKILLSAFVLLLGVLVLPALPGGGVALAQSEQFPQDFDKLTGHFYEPGRALGIWSDGTATMWVVGTEPRLAICPYDFTGDRDPRLCRDEGFVNLVNESARDPQGIWSNGETMWVANGFNPAKIVAYNMSTRFRDTDKDFDTLGAAGNRSPRGIWSDGTTMWVADESDNKIYAYNMSTKAHDATKDFALGLASGTRPTGIWSNGETMWVAAQFSNGGVTNGKIFAYNMSTKARDSDKDFDTLNAAGNTVPYGIWSDNTTMWVSDEADKKIFAYTLSTQARIAAPPSAGPGVEITTRHTGGSTAQEADRDGSFAKFTIIAGAAAGADITVNLQVSQTGDYVAAEDLGAQTALIPAGASSVTYSVAIVDDDIDEPPGTITVTIQSGDGYVVGTRASAETNVRSDSKDLPKITITADEPSRQEGDDAVFTIRILGQPDRVWGGVIPLTVSQEGNFFPGTAPTSVTIPRRATVFKLTIRTQDN